jgi:hypothetical protein
MMEAFVKWKDHKPRKGDVLLYATDQDEPKKRIGTVHKIEHALCWITYDDGHEPLPFIWCFKDALNRCFDWPTKQGKSDADPALLR